MKDYEAIVDKFQAGEITIDELMVNVYTDGLFDGAEEEARKSSQLITDINASIELTHLGFNGLSTWAAFRQKTNDSELPTFKDLSVACKSFASDLAILKKTVDERSKELRAFHERLLSDPEAQPLTLTEIAALDSDPYWSKRTFIAKVLQTAKALNQEVERLNSRAELAARIHDAEMSRADREKKKAVELLAQEIEQLKESLQVNSELGVDAVARAQKETQRRDTVIEFYRFLANLRKDILQYVYDEVIVGGNVQPDVLREKFELGLSGDEEYLAVDDEAAVEILMEIVSALRNAWQQDLLPSLLADQFNNLINRAEEILEGDSVETIF